MFIERPDASLYATSFGAGPRTIVAHGGWVGSGELWVPVFETLSRSWRAITFDHRGTGVTQTRGAITFEAMVDDLFAVLDRFSVGRCVLAAESSGALIVLEAALRQPERFEALVLVAGRHDSSPSARTDAMIAGCAANFDATMNAFVEACLPDGTPAQKHWGRMIVKRSDARSATELLLAMQGADAGERAAALPMPVLLMHGTADAIVPVASSEVLAARLASAELVVAEGAGHVPTVTRPEWVAAEIERFCRSITA